MATETATCTARIIYTTPTGRECAVTVECGPSHQSAIEAAVSAHGMDVDSIKRAEIEGPGLAPIRADEVLMECRTPAQAATRPGRVVLVELTFGHHRFVTGWQGDGDSGWTSGHYFGSYENAREDFQFRAKRGY